MTTGPIRPALPPGRPPVPGGGSGMPLVGKLVMFMVAAGAAYRIQEDYRYNKLPLMQTKVNAISQLQRQREWQIRLTDYAGSPLITEIIRHIQRGKIRGTAFIDRWQTRAESLYHGAIDNVIPILLGAAAAGVGFRQELSELGSWAGQTFQRLIGRHLTAEVVGREVRRAFNGIGTGVEFIFGRTVWPAVSSLYRSTGPLGVLAAGGLSIFLVDWFLDTMSGRAGREDLQNDINRMMIGPQ